MLAKITALVAHELHARLVGPVVAEYRKLDMPATCDRPHADDRPAYDVASTTSTHVERARQWDHDLDPPVRAAFGFTRPGAPSRLREDSARD